MRFRRWLGFAVVMLGASALAFPEVPKDSARALGATKGKAFEEGLVFVNGKYLPPPYLVERWGTGIRINGKSVTGQVIDWNEFLKTQDGAKVSKTETAVPAAAPAPAAPTTTAADEDEDTSLDDLFDDDPKPKKKKAKKSTSRPVAPPKPTSVVTVSFDGEFQSNDTTRKYVKRINAVRNRLDSQLRMGSFVFFGDGYSRIVVEPRMAEELIEKLPEMLRDSTSASDLYAKFHDIHVEYIPERVCDDLFNNRIDYRGLMERRKQLRKAAELKKLLNGTL